MKTEKRDAMPVLKLCRKLAKFNDIQWKPGASNICTTFNTDWFHLHLMPSESIHYTVQGKGNKHVLVVGYVFLNLAATCFCIQHCIVGPPFNYICLVIMKKLINSLLRKLHVTVNLNYEKANK